MSAIDLAHDDDDDDDDIPNSFYLHLVQFGIAPPPPPPPPFLTELFVRDHLWPPDL